MGWIVRSVEISSIKGLDKKLRFDTDFLVDTSATYLPVSAMDTSIMFVDTRADHLGKPKTLLGYSPLEQSRALVGRHEHRLFQAESFDLKAFQLIPSERSMFELRAVQITEKANT